VAADPRYLAVCVRAVRAGATQVVARMGTLDVRAKTSARDLVTEADVASERAIAATIRSAFPDHAVVGEESGRSGGAPGQAGLTWYVDPLDGTVNFAHGFPHFAVTAALVDAGGPLVGAVLDPLRGELFTASRGAGAALDGEPITVSGALRLAEALVIGSMAGGSADDPEHQVALQTAVWRAGRAVRVTEAAALDLCWVAAGRADGFWESQLEPWDMAAGGLIVSEAGGRVTEVGGEPWACGSTVLATNGRIHDQLAAVLAGATR
jgi:myo-inositol-1(or 4)-monophosphatase